MSGSNKFDPPPLITLSFSKHTKEGKSVLRLTYSTDAADAGIAKEQANFLAEQHIKNISDGCIPEKLLWLKTTYCTLYKKRSILIEKLDIDTTNIRNDAEEQCLLSVTGGHNYELLKLMLRLPESSFAVLDSKDDKMLISVQTKIGYTEWEETVGQGATDYLHWTDVSNAPRVAALPMFTNVSRKYSTSPKSFWQRVRNNFNMRWMTRRS